MAQNASEQMDAFQTSDSTTPRRAPAGTIQVLRLPQVCKMTGLCRSLIYQMEAEKRFPRRIKDRGALSGLDRKRSAGLAAAKD